MIVCLSFWLKNYKIFKKNDLLWLWCHISKYYSLYKYILCLFLSYLFKNYAVNIAYVTMSLPWDNPVEWSKSKVWPIMVCLVEGKQWKESNGNVCW